MMIDGYHVELPALFPGASARAPIWPTPRASDGAKMTGMSIARRHRKPDSLPEAVRRLTGAGRPHPLFVEALMGFPENWTALKGLDDIK